jgi:hypothetical protein
MYSDLDEKEALKTLLALREEHRALDREVAALGGDAMGDQLKLMRLKRQKLALKDQISELEDRIRPDIIA